MKVMFFITGIGYGDSIREYAIIKELLRREKDSEILVVGYNNSYKFFENKFNTTNIIGYNVPDYVFELRAYDFFKKNVLLPFSWYYNQLKLWDKINDFKPDLIVTDLEPIGSIMAKLTKKKLVCIFGADPEIIDSIKPNNKFLDLQKLYLKTIYNFKQNNRVVIPLLTGIRRKEENFEFINPVVRNNPKELPHKLKLMGKLRLNREPILIMLGGSNFGFSIAHELLNILNNFDEDFILFGYNYLYEKDNITCYPFKENFLEYLKVCKGVITLAGHSTLSEILVYKKPALVFPIGQHIEQLINATVLENRNLALVKHINEVSPVILNKHISEFLNKTSEIEDNVKKLNVKGDGAEDAVDILLEVNQS